MDKGSKFLSDLVFSRTYAKTKPNGFKETYEETVDRVLNMHCAKFPEHAEWIRGVCRQPMVDKWVVPSMRTMQFAGGGVERENFRGFNCSALAIDSFRAFAELFYVLMAGTGVGYSVQDHHVTELPIIPEKGRFETFKIPDSREGWCDSVLKLFENPMCVFDYSAIRPAGSPISSGGMASGPDALMLMHEKVSDILLEAGGRQLTPEEASDIVCHIADAVVVGGVRRCLPEDALVHTSRGMIPIKDVVVGDLVQTTKGMYNVLNNFKQGIQKTVIIETDGGVLECTPNHKVAVIDGYKTYTWKNAGELTVKDQLVFSNKPLVTTHISELPENLYTRSKHATTLKDINVPDLSGDIAWLLGYIQGNGYVDIHEDSDGKMHGTVAVSVPSNAPERVTKVEKTMAQFGVNVKVIDGCGKVKVVRCHSMQLASYMLENLKKPKTAMEVPSYILTAPVEIRQNFLVGLFDADGYSGHNTSICSIYPEFLQSVQQLCASLAIPTNIKKRREVVGNWKALFTLDFKSIGKDKLGSICEKFGTKPFRKNKKEQRCYGYSSIMVPWKKYPKAGFVSLSTLIDDEHDFIPVKVRSISQGRTVETYDIEVDTAHEFYSGGFLVHNSALICLFDSENMLTYKSGNWWEKNPQRGRANVSFVMKRDELKRTQFDDVLDKCFASFAGEPGVFLTNNKDMLTNPCVPYETVILTQEGPRQIGECVDQEIEIWNGFRWVLTTPRVTGENKLLVEVTLQDGRSLKCTLNHKFVLNNNINLSALSLLPGDVLLQSYLPDGSTVEGGVVKSVNYSGEVAKVFCFTDEVDGLGMFNGITTKQCAEISLKSQGLCNLSEINWGILHTKTDDEILKAINVAIVLGVLQASYTDFGYVDPKWKENAVDEALLGVSITGQAENFQRLKEFLSKHSLTPNLEGISKRFGIRQPKRVYTVKPSGSTSALLGCTSGIHAAHSNYYIRRVRVDKAHPVAKYLETIPEMTQFLETDKFTPSNYVISMPICKEGAITRAQETAVELMERAKFIKQNWIDIGHREGDNTHNVSLTVSYKPEEEAEVKQWMWENREIYNGISLLPYDGGTYVQAPFEEIDKETYERLIAVFPDIDLNSVNYGGTVDERAGESACAGGNCEVT